MNAIVQLAAGSARKVLMTRHTSPQVTVAQPALTGGVMLPVGVGSVTKEPGGNRRAERNEEAIEEGRSTRSCAGRPGAGRRPGPSRPCGPGLGNQ
jgi:hypothetical protein